MSVKTKRIVLLSVAGLLAAIMITAFVLCSMFYTTITGFFAQEISTTDYEKMASATRASAEISNQINEEGSVLLKNSGAEPLLPFKNLEKDGNGKMMLNVFGWGATDTGWLITGGGSGDASDTGGVVKFLAALDEGGFAVNPGLIAMYNAFYTNQAGTDADGNPVYKRNGMGINTNLDPMFRIYEPMGAQHYTPALMEQAHRHSDTALIVISRLGGEGNDLPYTQTKHPQAGSSAVADAGRTYLQLSAEEEWMVDFVAGEFEHVAVIINSGNAMELGFLEDERIDAALWVGMTGKTGAFGVVNVLKGEKEVVVRDEAGEIVTVETVPVSPTGKTVDVYPFAKTDDAVYAHGAGDARGDWSQGNTQYNNSGASGGERRYIDYYENIYYGYKWFETADAEGFWAGRTRTGREDGYDSVVQYPFGYGLTYTKFSWSNIKIGVYGGVNDSGAPIINDADTFRTSDADTFLAAQVMVKNDGQFPAKDIVQLYYTPEYYEGGIEKNAVNLGAFVKTKELAPGESETVTLLLDTYHMASFDARDTNGNGWYGYELERGGYTLSIRTDSHNVSAAENADKVFNLAADYLFDEDIEEETIILERDGDSIKVSDRTSKKTLSAATPLFTDQDPEDGVQNALDTVPVDGNLVYMTRAGDFKTAGRGFKTSKDSPRGKPTAVREAELRRPTERDLAEGEERREQGVVRPAGDMHIFAEIDGDNNVTVNETLVMRVGADYDDPQWDDILDQVTVDELWSVVQQSGHLIPRINSVGKPGAFDLDGPSGLNSNVMYPNASKNWTAFPVAVVIASTYNVELAKQFGLAVAAEATATNVSGWYAPGANMHRSAFAGRNFEYFSEDPVLAGTFAGVISKGALDGGLYAYVKHFAVNDCEDNREAIQTWLTEQSMREIYLRPFEIAIRDYGVNALMSSFNRIGAVWTGGSYALMTKVLREEWGFRGSVITDWADSGHADMKVENGLSAGNDTWLAFQGNNINANTAPSNAFKNDDNGIHLARTAVKNVLWTYANTMYLNRVSGYEVVVKKNVEMPFGWWTVWGFMPLCLLLVGGITVCVIFSFPSIFKRKTKPAASIADTETASDSPDTDQVSKE